MKRMTMSFLAILILAVACTAPSGGAPVAPAAASDGPPAASPSAAPSGGGYDYGY